ncbi:MAG: helix-turn-helix domain-containing protein [Planctomycetota bacterium]
MATDTDTSESQFRLLIFGDGTVRTVPLTGRRWTLGRALDCSITLSDPTVSRRHLMLERIGEQFRFRDLGGANPAVVDGRPCRVGTLLVGQQLTVGLTQITVELRQRPTAVRTNQNHTVVLSREIIDEELVEGSGAGDIPQDTATRVLRSIEWTFADLGDLADAAEPLLELALNLTGHQTGWLVRFPPSAGVETLASLSLLRPDFAPSLPDHVIDEARRIAAPHLLTSRESDGDRRRLMIPLGDRGDGLLVIEDEAEDAMHGQALLRLARSLGRVVWHRLQETMERVRLRDELERLRFHGTDVHNALLASNRLQGVREALRTHAGGSLQVWLRGEAGTEREQLARYLHAESERRERPFVCWNPSKTPSKRHADELFGDAGGQSATSSGEGETQAGSKQAGAVADGRPSLLARALGGTLFIDDFALLGHELQRELVTTLGAQAGPKPTALAFATTDTESGSSLAPEIATRCGDARVDIPSLRSEPGDVLTLAELFLSNLGPAPDGSPRLLSERAKRLLASYAWPGNVRELRLTIEAAAARAGSQPIAPRHLPDEFAPGEEELEQKTLPSLEEVEKKHIREVMRKTGGVRSRASRILGIANSTLYEKLKKYSID